MEQLVRLSFRSLIYGPCYPIIENFWTLEIVSAPLYFQSKFLWHLQRAKGLHKLSESGPKSYL